MKIIDKLKYHIKLPVNTEVPESKEFLYMSPKLAAQFPTLPTEGKPTQITSKAELKRNQKNNPQYLKLKMADLRGLGCSDKLAGLNPLISLCHYLYIPCQRLAGELAQWL